MPSSYHVLTGATSGLGLAVATALSTRAESHLLVGVRRPERADALREVVLSAQLTVFELNLESLASTRAFAQAITREIGDEAITSLTCNAGLQLTGPRQVTAEGFETTFATNYLSHFLLTRLLEPKLARNGTITTIGSGTHNPSDRLATRFGFRGAALPEDLSLLATGELGRAGSDAQQGMDRYATSKLCAILSARQWAAETADQAVRHYCFDPGLMPGTGLARERSRIEQLGWTYALPLLRFLVPGVSTSQSSGEALVRTCIDERSYPSGSYIEFTGQLARQSSSAADNELAKALHDVSLSLTEPFYLQP